MAPSSDSVLGRALVVAAGQEPLPPWRGAPVVAIDDAVLADPEAVVGRLHQAWATRSPVVVALAVDPASFREPRCDAVAPWRAGPGYEPWLDRLHFLVWANSYDARTGEPVWWWGRKAARLGATEGGPADVVLADGTPAWIDGGPRAVWPDGVEGAPVLPSDTVALASGSAILAAPPHPEGGGPPWPPVGGVSSPGLAADQMAAVMHGAGPARIIAPAGSGKTRVLTARLRELLAGRGYEPETVLAVAYNKKAQEEMAERTPELGARIQTLNAWGYGLVSRWLGRRPQVLDEREVRSIVERLVPRQQRRLNTDPLAPYLDGLSLIRLGLRDPQEVEDSLDDVVGLAAAFEPYREELRRRGAVDFDEQVYLAVEALLADGAFRRAVQAEHRHVLVDELQDLTPAHVLLLRLVTCPTYDVFGVGDDDQTIYGHAGADPRFLIDFDRWFPGAASHPLEVNYRCAAPITEAAASLLSYNHRRVAKVIRPGPDVAHDPDALRVRRHEPADGAETLVEVVQGWLHAGVAPAEVAVLTRVGSLLLAPHVALAGAGVPITSILGEEVLNRVGVRAALAYLRIATAPDDLDPADVLEVHRRPSRGLPTWVDKWLGRCRSVDAVHQAADRIDDAKVAGKLTDLAFDLDRLGDVARRGATTRQLLLAVRDDIGLGSAMTLLDSSGGASGSHLDDLEGLLQVADLHPDAASFEPWLRGAFHREHDSGGVTLSTVHRVKGREWPRVAVFGVTAGIVPHRLAEERDQEEERRVLHVAITRGRDEVVVLADDSRPSPFLAELDGSAPHTVAAPAVETTVARRAADRRRPAPAADRVVAELGRSITVLGGYEGTIAELAHTGVRVELAEGGTLFVRYGERVRTAEAGGVLAAPPSALAEPAAVALRAWRTERSKSDRVPAYVVLSDKHLEGIAAVLPATLEELRACPGIGPAKLDTYGDDILAVLAGVAAADEAAPA